MDWFIGGREAGRLEFERGSEAAMAAEEEEEGTGGGVGWSGRLLGKRESECRQRESSGRLK